MTTPSAHEEEKRATVRIVQNKGEFSPRVMIAETGERIKGVISVEYQSESGNLGRLTLELAAMEHEVDISLDVDVKQKKHSDE